MEVCDTEEVCVVCQEPPSDPVETTCEHVYVDTSPNRSRRYCSERCSSRANVAAYRARRRAVASA